MTQTFETLTREQLYVLVWREPLLKIAPRYGVSPTYMALVCAELRVPRPPNGHWSQVEHGKASPAPPLPSVGPDDLKEWNPGVVLTAPARPLVKRPRLKRLDDEALADGPRLRPAKQPPVHALLVGAKPHFLKTRKPENGLLRPLKRHLVDIITSEKSVERALDVANLLFSTLTKNGHPVTTGEGYARRPQLDEREVPNRQRYHHYLWAPDKPTVTTVAEMEFGLTVFETTESVETVYVGSSKYVPVRDLSAALLARLQGPHHWRHHEDVPSGRFGLQVYVRGLRVAWVKRWQEAKAGEFGSLIPTIIAALEAAVPELTAQHAEASRKAEEEHRRWQAERRLAEEAAQRARLARNRQEATNDLLVAIASWEQTRSIHSYFQAAAQEADALPEFERKAILERLSEARALVGEVDALAKLRAWKAPMER